MTSSRPIDANGAGAAPDAAAIAQQITSDINACQALLQLMDAERDALQERDVERLGAVIEEKVQYLSHLEQSAIKRSQWASRAQTADADSGWHQLLHDLKEPELNQQWEQLKELMIECRRENETNGKILARNQNTVGRLLNIMRGQTDAPSLYSAKGSKTGGSSSHLFGEA